MIKEYLLQALLEWFPINFWQTMIKGPLVVPFYHIVTDENVPHIENLYRFRSVAEFKSDLDFLLQHFKPVCLHDILTQLQEGRIRTRRQMLMTFDDGFREVYEVVAPILLNKGVPATFFLSTAFLDNKAICHDAKVSLLIDYLIHSKSPQPLVAIHALLDEAGVTSGELPARLKAVVHDKHFLLDKIAALVGFDFETYLKTVKPYLSTNQVKDLINDGFSIGSHSIDHSLYAELTLEQQLHQTYESVNELKKRFHLNYSAFAFPYWEIGVSHKFFDFVFENKILDVSFGTRGLIADEFPRQLHRFTFEITSYPAKQVLSRKYLGRFAKTMIGKGLIVRD